MNISTIHLPADLNSADAIAAANRMRPRIQGGSGAIRVSLQGVRTIDGSGMSALYRIVANARQAKRKVEVVNVSNELRSQLNSFGLHHLVRDERPGFFERLVGRTRLATA